MSFDFAKVDLLYYSEMKMHYFGVPSLDAQNELLKGRFGPAPSFVDEGQTRPVASAIVDDTEDDDEWGWEGAAGMEDAKRVGTKHSLRDFHYSLHGKMCRVPKTVAEELELAT